MQLPFIPWNNRVPLRPPVPHAPVPPIPHAHVPPVPHARVSSEEFLPPPSIGILARTGTYLRQQGQRWGLPSSGFTSLFFPSFTSKIRQR
jgi:hypothetical protein